MYGMAKLPTKYNRRLQDIAVMMYTVKKEMVPNYILELFDTLKRGYNLRGNGLNVHRNSTSSFGKHYIKHPGPYVWYRLSDDDRKEPSITLGLRLFQLMLAFIPSKS